MPSTESFLLSVLALVREYPSNPKFFPKRALLHKLLNDNIFLLRL